MTPLRILVAHSDPDVYGSDRQLAEVVGGFIIGGFEPVVCLPTDGPLVPILEERGATIRISQYPVVRRAMANPLGAAALLGRTMVAIPRLIRVLRRVRPDVVYVNTVTIPIWLLAAWLCRIPSLCHVREAEEVVSRPVRWALAAPQLLARAVVTNSEASRRALVDAIPRLSARTTVIYNGIAGPEIAPDCTPTVNGPTLLVVVGRLAPHKGIDVALDALGRLVTSGRDARLTVCGTVYPGNEWFESELHRRAGLADLAGRVTFAGYVDPIWPVIASADIVLVPSRAEPFGNTAVEGMLTCRPVVASAVQGLPEIIRHRETGLLVPPGDSRALADAVALLLDEPRLAREVAVRGRADALRRFGTERQRAELGELITKVADGSDRTTLLSSARIRLRRR